MRLEWTTSSGATRHLMLAEWSPDGLYRYDFARMEDVRECVLAHPAVAARVKLALITDQEALAELRAQQDFEKLAHEHAAAVARAEEAEAELAELRAQLGARDG